MTLRCRKCKDTGTLVTWEQSEPFNPASPPQTRELIKSFGLKVPTKRGENRETTEAKYLKRFGKKPGMGVFNTLLDVRRRNKMISDYMWPLDAEDTVRTQFGFHPSTWRKSSRNPNLQVIPIRDPELAYLVRRTLTARPGHLLVEADSEGIEAVFMAYLTGDPLMMKVAKAGPHGFFMSHLPQFAGQAIDPQLPFPELKAASKRFKKLDPLLYDTCKRTIHGTHYGLTPFGMHDEFEEQFPTLKMAKELQQQYLNLWPVLVQTMARIREQAHQQRYLDNHFQYRHYFYNVFSWDSRRRDYVLGEDGKRVIAFIPQSDGSAAQTEYLLEFEDRAEQDNSYRDIAEWERLLIHDSFVFEVPEREALDWVPQALAGVMNMPLAELGGLRVGVEVKVGPNLGEQSTVEVELTV